MLLIITTPPPILTNLNFSLLIKPLAINQIYIVRTILGIVYGSIPYFSFKFIKWILDTVLSKILRVAHFLWHRLSPTICIDAVACSKCHNILDCEASMWGLSSWWYVLLAWWLLCLLSHWMPQPLHKHYQWNTVTLSYSFYYTNQMW